MEDQQAPIAVEEHTIHAASVRLIASPGQRGLTLRFETGDPRQPLHAYNFPLAPELAVRVGDGIAAEGRSQSGDLSVVNGPVNLDEIAKRATAARG